MKKCLLMFGLLVLTLIIAMITGLSNNETVERPGIVESQIKTPELLSDLNEY